jgi:hypothetical protein
VSKEKLSKKQRRIVREIARDAWVEANGNPQRAKRMAKERIKQKYGSAWAILLVSIAVRIAFMLIEWWFNNRISDPGVDPYEGEPDRDS